jgi:hypothetical protein
VGCSGRTTAGTHRAYTACRSGSGVQRGVRHHLATGPRGSVDKARQIVDNEINLY